VFSTLGRFVLRRPLTDSRFRGLRYGEPDSGAHPRLLTLNQTLLERYYVEGEYRDVEAFKALEKCFEQEHRGPMAHAHFMRTFCQRISPPQQATPPKAPPKDVSKPLITVSEEPSDLTVVSSHTSGSLTPQRSAPDRGGASTPTPKSDSKKKSKSEQMADRHPKRPKRTSGHPGNPPGTKQAKATAKLPTQLAWDVSELPGSNGSLVLFVGSPCFLPTRRCADRADALPALRNRPAPT